jgi:hypothetical protein
MKNLGPQLSFSLLILAAAITLACGSSSRKLQSVTVSPATADAKNFPNGQVQFMATAVYNTKPSPVSPATATWGACTQSATTNLVSVSSTGVAQCASGASGTFTISAFVVNPSIKHCIQPLGGVPTFSCGYSCYGVVGQAQITCP